MDFGVDLAYQKNEVVFGQPRFLSFVFQYVALVYLLVVHWLLWLISFVVLVLDLWLLLLSVVFVLGVVVVIVVVVAVIVLLLLCCHVVVVVVVVDVVVYDLLFLLMFSLVVVYLLSLFLSC